MTGSATLTASTSNSALEAQQMNTNHDIRRPGMLPLSATWPRWYRERRARYIRTGVARPNVWTVYKSRLGWVALTPDGSCSMLRGYSTSDWAAVYRHANTEARKEAAR